MSYAHLPNSLSSYDPPYIALIAARQFCCQLLPHLAEPVCVTKIPHRDSLPPCHQKTPLRLATCISTYECFIVLALVIFVNEVVNRGWGSIKVNRGRGSIEVNRGCGSIEVQTRRLNLAKGVRKSMQEYARVCKSTQEYARVCKSMQEYVCLI